MSENVLTSVVKDKLPKKVTPIRFDSAPTRLRIETTSKVKSTVQSTSKSTQSNKKETINTKNRDEVLNSMKTEPNEEEEEDDSKDGKRETDEKTSPQCVSVSEEIKEELTVKEETSKEDSSSSSNTKCDYFSETIKKLENRVNSERPLSDVMDEVDETEVDNKSDDHSEEEMEVDEVSEEDDDDDDEEEDDEDCGADTAISNSSTSSENKPDPKIDDEKSKDKKVEVKEDEKEKEQEQEKEESENEKEEDLTTEKDSEEVKEEEEFNFPSIEISDVRTVQELELGDDDAEEGDKSKDDSEKVAREEEEEKKMAEDNGGGDKMTQVEKSQGEDREMETEKSQNKQSEEVEKSRHMETEAEIKNFAKDTMNELLGLFGYEKMDETESGKSKSTAITSEEKEEPAKDTKQVQEKKDEKVENKQEIENKSKPAKNRVTLRPCTECNKAKTCKYQVLMHGSTRYLCDDNCFRAFRTRQKLTTTPQQPPKNRPITRSLTTPKDYCNICRKEIKNGLGLLPGIGENKPLCSEECLKKYHVTYAPKSACSQCGNAIQGRNKCLTWETMEFCNEECLGRYQSFLGSHCACCKSGVQRTSLGKYCVRFGSDIKQFCSNGCLEEFKKRLKVCSFCQKDISNSGEGILVPVKDKRFLKDFCSQCCVEKYEAMNRKSNALPTVHQCSVCEKTGPISVQVVYEGKTHKLCSEQCIAAFRYTNKINTSICDTCHKFFDAENSQPFTIQIEGLTKRFCAKTCMNVFVLSNRKIVPCTWCKVKKYNFDMIERVDSNNHVQLFCSLNCLSLFRVSLNATSSKSVRCDYCQHCRPAQYHLTMSDASIRNFCSYQCVMSFQSQFTNMTPVISTSSKMTTTTTSTSTSVATSTQATGTPVISAVMSLAPTQQQQTQQIIQAPKIIVPARPQTTSILTPITVTTTGTSTVNLTPTQNVTQIQQQVLVKPPPPKQFKNKSLLCRPYMQTKGVSCKPHPCHKSCQTDKDETPAPVVTPPKPIIIPVPVPIYVPMPMHMYVNPVPVPVPFPLPIPVPIFIPTTKSTIEEISKQMKEIQEKIPSNPFEAELLMMAEMVANNNKSTTDNANSSGSSNSNNSNGNTTTTTTSNNNNSSTSNKSCGKSTTSTVPASTTTSNGDHVTGNDTEQDEQFGMENQISDGMHATSAFSEDMLQMALRMATEMDEPAMDIESALGPGTNQSPHDTAFNSIEENNSDALSPRELRARNRSMKRTGGSHRGGGRGRKKARVDENSIQMTPSGLATPADSESVLKYTYGVNAWKHWVLQKNTQLEKASQTNRKLKLFKTDLLQLTADELNYSLCLFVKEVRKPNREEYAPDSIFYLCLGIQQYLFENGRIDNIFTDAYYEKFTECLNEVLQKAECASIGAEVVFTSRIEEEILWEAKQLGAHSPHVLLNTLMYFNTKFFMLRTVEDHLKLSFSHVMKHWKKSGGSSSVASPKSSNGGGNGGRNVLLKYCPPPTHKGDVGRKRKDEQPSFEQLENLDNPLRCPVKLYEFYLSKCPESIKNRTDIFYLYPERSCVPDSPVWYSTMPLGKESVSKMLQRIKTVREVCEVF